MVCLMCVLSLSASMPANAMMVNVPLEILVSRAELIVTGKVTMVAVPAQFQRPVPGQARPIKAWFTEYQLTLTRVIKTAEGVKAAKGQTITIVAQAAPPRQPGLIMADGPAYPSLRKGTSYVLVLQKDTVKGQYYLPSYPKNFRLDRKQDVAPIVKATEVDKWPWGKPVNGLQFALVTTRSWAQLGRQVVRRRVGNKWVKMPPSVHVQCVMALRNTTRKPITVSVYPGDRFLALGAVNDAGKKTNVDFYAYLQTRKIPPFDPAGNTLKVEPGKITFISSYGKGEYGIGFNLAAPAGKWKLTATYAAERKGAGLWVGALSSAAVDLEVRAARKR